MTHLSPDHARLPVDKKWRINSPHYCGGRWVALGGGGYDLYRVVVGTKCTVLRMRWWRPLAIREQEEMAQN